jgi:hypothetical protein
VETLEQVSPILVFLFLVLLDGGKVFSCLSLPLGALMKCVLDLLLVLFDGGEPIVKARALHLLLKITHGLVMVAISREGTYIFPDGHSRLLHSAAADSS